MNRVHAFFHLHCVHHISLFSMPYTLRHFLTSLRVFLCIGELLGEELRVWPDLLEEWFPGILSADLAFLEFPAETCK